MSQTSPAACTGASSPSGEDPLLSEASDFPSWSLCQSPENVSGFGSREAQRSHSPPSPVPCGFVVKRYRKNPLPIADSPPEPPPKPAFLRPSAKPEPAPRGPFRLSDSSRRPVCVMLQPCPAPRPGPQPRFTARVLPSSPLFRPVPRRASEYSKTIPSAASQPHPVRAHCGSTAGPPSAPPTASQSTATAYRFQEMPLRKRSQGPSGFVTQKDVHSETRAKALQLWQNMRSVLLPLSSVLQELSGSSHPESLEDRLLSGVSETTLLRYLQGFKGFLHALHTLDRALDSSLRQVDIADALLTMHNMGTHVLNGLKSLRWAQKTLLLSLPDLYQGLMHSVSYRVESDRKEAFPLPLFVLAALERQLLLDMGSPARRLFIGAVLTSCWSSLRLSDSQHVSWSSIQAGSWCTRGTSYRTKVSRRGVPFGLLNEGFYSAGRSFACTWVARYLRLLGEEWDALEASFGSVTPDCLFFSSSAGEFQPLTYGEVLNQLRGLLISIGLSTEEAGTFTVHSMKVCLLSVVAQRGFRVSRREAQGHHKSSSHSAKLYSRDDVWPALAAQKSLMRSISQGWWPSTPLARGGRHPVPQRAIAHLSVEIQPIAPHPRFPVLDASLHSVPEPCPSASHDRAGPSSPIAAADASSDSSSSSETIAHAADAFPQGSARQASSADADECEEHVFLVSPKGVWHVGFPHSGPDGSSFVRAGKAVLLRPKCGALARSYSVQDKEPPPDARLCMHAACRKLLSE